MPPVFKMGVRQVPRTVLTASDELLRSSAVSFRTPVGSNVGSPMKGPVYKGNYATAADF